MQKSGEFDFEDIKIHYEIKKVRFLRLKLSNEGDFKLSIPYRCSQAFVLEFLNKNKSWLQKKCPCPKAVRARLFVPFFLSS